MGIGIGTLTPTMPALARMVRAVFPSAVKIAVRLPNSWSLTSPSTSVKDWARTIAGSAQRVEALERMNALGASAHRACRPARKEGTNEGCTYAAPVSGPRLRWSAAFQGSEAMPSSRPERGPGWVPAPSTGRVVPGELWTDEDRTARSTMCGRAAFTSRATGSPSKRMREMSSRSPAGAMGCYQAYGYARLPAVHGPDTVPASKA